jgi:hypothetical protein
LQEELHKGAIDVGRNTGRRPTSVARKDDLDFVWDSSLTSNSGLGFGTDSIVKLKQAIQLCAFVTACGLLSW